MRFHNDTTVRVIVIIPGVPPMIVGIGNEHCRWY